MKLNPKHYIRLWREPWRRVFWDSFYAWRRDKGEAKRFDLGFLQPGDMVLDFGGYEGEWTARMVDEHGVSAHVFEPHPDFAQKLEARFAEEPRVTCHPCALGQMDGTLTLSDDADASSALVADASGVSGQIRRASDVLAALTPPAVLAKINIEGGEYDLIPAIDAADWWRHIRTVQVQFHLYGPDDIPRRDEMRAILAKTHTCDWEYPFVWEQWSLRQPTDG